MKIIAYLPDNYINPGWVLGNQENFEVVMAVGSHEGVHVDIEIFILPAAKGPVRLVD
jgi:hypothetical protein